ncbi:MAG: OmpA family protein [Deltaproteobacteria bacterium]|nr:OmpA family protein [Deltaproteobacteria bacterium]
MKASRILLGAALCALALSARPAWAAWDDYEDTQSHPLRLAAYLMHPIGWLTEWTVMRPFHFIVSATEPQEAFFGHRPHPSLLVEPGRASSASYSRSMPQAQAQTPTRLAAVPPKAPASLAPPETVRIVEVPVEKIVVKEVQVQKIVEVEKLVFPQVAFAFDSANLTDLGKGQVYLAAQRLKEKADVTVVIEGHADSLGSDDYNQKLGLQRAQMVMKELVAQGVDTGRISTASLGENKPLIGTDTAWARAVNRRVEFQVKAAR